MITSCFCVTFQKQQIEGRCHSSSIQLNKLCNRLENVERLYAKPFPTKALHFNVSHSNR